MNISYRSAIIYKDNQVREMREFAAGSPKNGVKWIFHLHIFWYVEQDTVLSQSRSKRGKFAIFRLHDLTDQLRKQVGVIFLSGAKISEDYTLPGKGCIQL